MKKSHHVGVLHVFKIACMLSDVTRHLDLSTDASVWCEAGLSERHVPLSVEIHLHIHGRTYWQ